MKEVLTILQDPAVGDLATVDNGKPRVRPFGFMFEENGKYYFCTNNTKNVYRQLMENPYIEYTKTNKNMVWVRISGKIKFDEDLRKKQKCFESFPGLKDIYKSPDNPIFKVFYLEHGEATIDSFSPEPQKKFNF